MKKLFSSAVAAAGKARKAAGFLTIIVEIGKNLTAVVKKVKQIITQLDRIESKLDRVLECVDVDPERTPPQPRAKRPKVG